MHELPLVFFTVLGQSAAGLYLFAYLSRKLGKLSENQLRSANITAFIIMIIALVIGGLHVGQPLRFFNMLLGVGRSPMSNEALLSGIFVTWGAATLLFTLVIKNKLLSEICNIATVIFGLAFVWSIPQVYNIATVANWFTVFTTLQMWMTLLVAGGALAILFGAKWLGAAAFLMGSIIIFATRAAYISYLGETGPEISAEQTDFWGFQLIILAAMLFIYPTLLFRGSLFRGVLFSGILPRGINSPIAFSICAITIILAELSGRVAFYNLWQISM